MGIITDLCVRHVIPCQLYTPLEDPLKIKLLELEACSFVF